MQPREPYRIWSAERRTRSSRVFPRLEYAGHTADQVQFLGAIGADPGIIAVAKDSPHGSLVELLDAVKADPSSVTFAGGSAAGGFDHLKVLMALGRTGFTDITKVKYIGVGGGADAITQTIGGHTQAMTGDMSEVVGFLKSGDIQVVAVFTEERVPGFEDIPTAREQGIDIVARTECGEGDFELDFRIIGRDAALGALEVRRGDAEELEVG